MQIEEEMKVGPKGQVVIPRVFRSAMKITPGSKVIVRLENDKIIVEKKKAQDVALEFEKMANRGRSMRKKIDPHGYEEELQGRLKSVVL
jgi:AbrB family looped-hinge helix DNA binding protein